MRKQEDNAADLTETGDRLLGLAIGGMTSVVGGVCMLVALRALGLRWTWPTLGLPAAALAYWIEPAIGVRLAIACATALTIGGAWHFQDLERGGQEAQRERERLGPGRALTYVVSAQRARRQRVRAARFAVGRAGSWRVRTVPFGSRQGVRGLVVGAPGSGKTVTMSALADAYVRRGVPVVAIDPKGDRSLSKALEVAAAHTGRPFLEWSPEGPSAYNPVAAGDASEIADKLIAGEAFTEPHYMRQAQRYLGFCVRALQEQGAGPPSLRQIATHMDPARLELLADHCPEALRAELDVYLGSLSARQRSDLGGVRDRLAVLAESTLGRWLEPGDSSPTIDLAAGWQAGAVTYFRLDSDRYPLAAEMLGASIVSDLVSLTGRLQGSPTLGLVMIDEFSALGAQQIARILSRSRSAGISVLVGTQGLADLGMAAGADSDPDALTRQVLSQLDFLVAHRQSEPQAAELLAEMAGTRARWTTTRMVAGIGSAAYEQGTRTRDREFVKHPDEFKRLGVGEAIVIEPASPREAEHVHVWPHI